MKETFYLFIIMLICRAITNNTPDDTIDQTTPGADETPYTDYYDSNDTLEYNGTDSTIEYTGKSRLYGPSTRRTSTRRTSTSRPTHDPPRTTLFHRYQFEGVDYYDLPTDLKDYNTDCYGQHMRCIRFRTDHYQVCGYNSITRYYDDFYSPCEIELQNCLYRVKKGFGIFGTNYTNDIIFYNGEAINCIYYLRRAKTMEEMHKLYFGGRLGEHARDDDDDDDY